MVWIYSEAKAFGLLILWRGWGWISFICHLREVNIFHSLKFQLKSEKESCFGEIAWKAAIREKGWCTREENKVAGWSRFRYYCTCWNWQHNACHVIQKWCHFLENRKLIYAAIHCAKINLSPCLGKNPVCYDLWQRKRSLDFLWLHAVLLPHV